MLADLTTRQTPKRCVAVFLDRDGVINRAIIKNGKPHPPTGLADLEILPGVAEALAILHRAGFLLIVVTNQPDVARGTQTREAVNAIHTYLMKTLPLDGIKVCWGTGTDSSDCYKPKPGMLLEAAGEHGIDLAGSFMVGDRWRDIGAGKAAGTFTIFIDYGYQEPLLDKPDAIVHSLADAATIILRRMRRGEADVDA